MEKKLSKLERKTQEAIHSLIRKCPQSENKGDTDLFRAGQRLAAQKGDSDDLVGAMRAQEKAQNDIETLSDDEE